MNLHFTWGEKIAFLQKRNYEIVTVNTWENHTQYHNDVVTSYTDVICAVKNGTKLPLDDDGQMNKTIAQREYSLDVIFYQELSKALLSL